MRQKLPQLQGSLGVHQPSGPAVQLKPQHPALPGSDAQPGGLQDGVMLNHDAIGGKR